MAIPGPECAEEVDSSVQKAALGTREASRTIGLAPRGIQKKAVAENRLVKAKACPALYSCFGLYRQFEAFG